MGCGTCRADEPVPISLAVAALQKTDLGKFQHTQRVIAESELSPGDIPACQDNVVTAEGAVREDFSALSPPLFPKEHLWRLIYPETTSPIKEKISGKCSAPLDRHATAGDTGLCPQRHWRPEAGPP